MTSHVCAAIKTNAVAIMTQVKSSEGCDALIVLVDRGVEELLPRALELLVFAKCLEEAVRRTEVRDYQGET